MNYGYGVWVLVVMHAAFFIIFAASFTRPRTGRDWRSLGAFSAFIVALFAEMYGFPLTIYLLSGWLGTRFPGLNLFSHEAGHLWNTILGLKVNPHFNPIHLASNVMIVSGLIILSSAWRVLFKAQRTRTIAQTGLYAKIRHPQYVAFVLVMFGFLVQWPTLLTVLMFPILLIMYVRLAKREEKDAIAEFGNEYIQYMERTAAFIPKLRYETVGSSKQEGFRGDYKIPTIREKRR